MKALTIAAVLLVAGGVADAQVLAQPPSLHGHLAGFGGDPAQLLRAVAALERHGARVVEIRFDSRLGHPAYDAVVELRGKARVVRLARDGAEIRLLKQTDEPRWMLGRRVRADLSRAAHAEVGLAAAVRAAEDDSAGAPAVAAGIAPLASDPVRPAPAYNVLLMRPDGRLERVAVDARTRLVIAKLGSPGAAADEGRGSAEAALVW
jgi:hypothetical protein